MERTKIERTIYDLCTWDLGVATEFLQAAMIYPGFFKLKIRYSEKITKELQN